MKARPNPRAIKLAAEVRKRITTALGKPVKVILYGSQARGDATEESDIDLLVILPSVDGKISRLVSDIAWEVGYESGALITTMPETQDEWQRLSNSPFYGSVEREGVSA